MDTEMPMGLGLWENVIEQTVLRIRCTDHWCQMIISSDYEWNQKQPLANLGKQMDTKLPLCLSISEPIDTSDPGLADNHTAATGPGHDGAHCRNLIQCIHHWCQMTLNNEDTWKPKQSLNSLVWQLDTELPPDLAFQSLLLNSDPELADRHRIATGPWRVIECHQTRIMHSHHRCQMNLSTNDEWNWKYNLTYLGQQRTQSCHGPRHEGAIAELGSGTQITVVRSL
ncbi:hypothetical protein NN561_020063 [Cricetulus griseus]